MGQVVVADRPGRREPGVYLAPADRLDQLVFEGERNGLQPLLAEPHAGHRPDDSADAPDLEVGKALDALNTGTDRDRHTADV